MEATQPYSPSAKAATDKVYINGSGHIPMKLDLQKYMAGWICPVQPLLSKSKRHNILKRHTQTHTCTERERKGEILN